MNSIPSRLDAALRAVAPIAGVSLGSLVDKATWSIDFEPSATPAEKIAAEQVLQSFDTAEPAVLPTLTPRQLRLMLPSLEITEGDIEAKIVAMPDPAQRFAAQIEWEWATVYKRDHPLVAYLANEMGFVPGELDALWAFAADL